ncbi:MAG TPA: hypothetical protein VK983_00945 [Candidatus Limnocylindrales bacterium]|nr:hypothetical protein [Candidatus Limnocylindrales bacterium]
MKIKHYQDGFGQIAVPIVIVTMGVIGFAGWRIMSGRPAGTKPIAATEQKQQVNKSSRDKEIAIPSDWQWFTSKDSSVNFAYPKTWGSLIELEKAYTSGYYSNKGNFMRPVVIMAKSDFLIQVPKSSYDPSWYKWDLALNALVRATDEKASDIQDGQQYDAPIELGATTALEPHILSGPSNHPIFRVLGKGAMNCGARHYLFDIKDKVVHISANLCNRGGDWKPQAGQDYVDVVETPLKEFYDYIEG